MGIVNVILPELTCVLTKHLNKLQFLQNYQQQ